MKKLFGIITIGGLHHKILKLVLVNMLALILIFAAVSFFQSRTLSDISQDSRNEQQEAITAISEDTMRQVIEGSLTKTNALQAYIAGEMMSSLRSNVLALQSLAVGIFEHRSSFAPHSFYPPDKADAGKVTAQALGEEGVDIYSSDYLPIAAHMSDTMTALMSSSEQMLNFYIGLADGTCLCIDYHPENKIDENGNIISFPVRDRAWYNGAIEAGDVYFSGVVEDKYSGSLCVVCAAPVYANGELVGVVGADLFLDSMSEYVNESAKNGGFISIVNENGQVIFAPENNGVFTVDTFDVSEDLRKSENAELAAFITKALESQTDLCTVNVGGRQYYMAASPISTIGWTVVSVVEKEVTEQPTRRMISEFDRISDEAAESYRAETGSMNQATLIIMVCVIIIGVCGVLHFAGRIVEPIEEMTRNITESSKTGKLFEMKDMYRTGDEIEVLADAFDDLSKKTKQYIEDITRITKEKERIGTELELARKIQADMLPNIYPAFPDRKEFDIYATMTPAKEVGGDFYDFFLIDDDHLGMVIADVSGKGVPAALFMMMSKILINNYALQGDPPGKVLELTNAAICKKNDDGMFVTVWLGVLEISTGRITAANAGHEFPIIRNGNGEYELLQDKHGFVIGGIKGMRYDEYEIQLEKGSSLFVYTDGAAEAENTENEQFGTDRLVEILNRNKELGPRELLPQVKAAIDEFVGKAEQFDDLTMLSLKLF